MTSLEKCFQAAQGRLYYFKFPSDYFYDGPRAMLSEQSTFTSSGIISGPRYSWIPLHHTVAMYLCIILHVRTFNFDVIHVADRLYRIKSVFTSDGCWTIVLLHATEKFEQKNNSETRHSGAEKDWPGVCLRSLYKVVGSNSKRCAWMRVSVWNYRPKDVKCTLT